jgi:hypothetical protein
MSRLSRRWYVDFFILRERSEEFGERLTRAQVGPSAPIDAYGPGSSTFDAKLRHHLAPLRRLQFDAASTLVIALVMFLLGVAVAVYGPPVLEKVVGRQ